MLKQKVLEELLQVEKPEDKYPNNENNNNNRDFNQEFEEIITLENFDKDWIGSIHQFNQTNQRWKLAGKYVPKFLALIIGSAVFDGFADSILERSKSSPFNSSVLYTQYALAIATFFSSLYAWHKHNEHKKLNKSEAIELVQEFIEKKSAIEQFFMNFRSEIEQSEIKNNPEVQSHIKEIEAAFTILQDTPAQKMFIDLNLNLNSITQSAEIDARIEQGYSRTRFLELTSYEDLDAVIANIDKIFTHIFAIQEIVQQQNQVVQEVGFASIIKSYAQRGMSVAAHTFRNVFSHSNGSEEIELVSDHSPSVQ